MWAALFSGVPTINLHTSAFPNSWPLRDFYFHQGRSFTNKDLLREVRRWARRHKLNPARIRVIEKKHLGGFKVGWAATYVPMPNAEP